MKETFIYDLPTRVFHWLFALLFTTAFTIANTVDDESSAFSYHMLTGIVLCFLVALRVVWGFFGTKYSRFTEFSLYPKELAFYLKGVLTGDKRKWIGHNPASSWAALTMMAFTLGLGVTGYLMATGQGGDTLEDVHELLANGFLVIVILHIAGLALHTLRHRDALWKSIFTGRKEETSEQSTPVPSCRAIGILLLLVTISFSTYLTLNYDSRSQNLDLFGTRLHLGETEGEEHEGQTGEREHESHGTGVNQDDV